MNVLELATLHRPGAKQVGQLGGAQTERMSYDLVVNGVSLYTRLDAESRDLIGALGWLPADENRLNIDRLLLKSDPPALGERQMLFICPECGDLGCGALTCEVVREGSTIIWRRFGYENDYRPEMSEFARFSDVGPFRFDWEMYRRTIESAAIRAGAV